MKCYLVDGKGIDSIQQVERPNPEPIGARDVLVQVKACSLNYRDLMIARGEYRSQVEPQRPHIALSDMSGVIVATGKDVTEWQVGDRVLNSVFRHWPAGTLQSRWARTDIGNGSADGVLAEQVLYPAGALVAVPSHFSYIEASTIPVAGLTAWTAIVNHGKTRPGNWVLLQGTGGVSLFAAQIARGIGARIILMTSSAEKAERMRREFGVFATVNYLENQWPEQVKEITKGEGIDVIVDVVGGETLSKSLSICAYGARVAVVGVLGGKETTLRVRDLLTHQVHLRGTMVGSTEELRSCVKAMEALNLKPVIDRIYPFSKSQEAYRYLESQKHMGKVVIDLES